MKCLGLMSGTSMDGVDCAIVDVRPGRSTLRIALLAHRTYPYPPAIREQLLSLLRTGTVETVCRLHAAVGEVFARVANRTIRQAKLAAKDVAVIGSHGQIYLPPSPNFRSHLWAASLYLIFAFFLNNEAQLLVPAIWQVGLR